MHSEYDHYRWRLPTYQLKIHRVVVRDGLINYADTKAKCRHLKKWPAKELRGRCLSECTSNLNSVSTPPPHPPPLPCVNKYTVYTYTCTVCKGGMEFWAQIDKHLPQSPFTGQWRHFALPWMSLIFLRGERMSFYFSSTYLSTAAISDIFKKNILQHW